MEKDRTELNNLAGKAPAEAELKREFNAWTERVGVEDWEKLQPTLKKLWGMEDIHG